MMADFVTGLRTGARRFVNIDRNDPTPLYRQLEDILRAQIEEGHYAVGSILPSESEIGSMWDVSRSVVRQTLNSLALHGIIRTEKGRGSFVAEKKVTQSFVQRTTGFFDELSRAGKKVEARVVRQEIVDITGEAADFLGVDKALEIARIRSVEGRVITFVRTLLIPDEFPGLEKMALENQSLYQLLADKYNVHIHGGKRTIEAVLAEGEVSEYLEVPRGSPLLLLRSAGTDRQGRPMEWFDAWHRADRTRFELMILPEDPIAPLQQKVVAPAAGESTLEMPKNEDHNRSDFFASSLIVTLEQPGSLKETLRAADALYGAGVRSFLLPVKICEEGTIEALRSLHPDVHVGVSSVNSLETYDFALGFRPDAIFSDVTLELSHSPEDSPLVVLGGSTMNEVLRAWEKTHVAAQVVPTVGVGIFEGLSARLREVPLIPQIPADSSEFDAYFKAGASRLVVMVATNEATEPQFLRRVEKAMLMRAQVLSEEKGAN